MGTAPPPTKNIEVVKAAGAADCYLLRNIRVKHNKAVSSGGAPRERSFDPSPFGPHVGPPHQQADGAYLTEPEEAAVVASLNDGRMAIQYAPDLPEEIQLELKGLYDSMYGGTLLFPNDTMHYAVAATTWTNLLACSGYDGAATLNAIRAFGKATWGKYGNVSVTKYPAEGPTPAHPEEPSKSG